MKPDETPAENYHEPVAYDAQGRPLYAHPPRVLKQPAVQQVVHVARSFEPVKLEVSDDAKKRHERSKRLYPMLNLSDGEFVIMAVRRHLIGLILPISGGVFLIALALTVLFNYPALVELLMITGQLSEVSVITTPILLFCMVIGLGMFVVYYVYTNNKFFMTNESVVQEIQISLFSRNEQTVSLGNIEDASYVQHGIIQQIFNYGAIRLSTEGDETTYRFTYVANPKQHIATLNNAVEAFKNGRPVEF
ncbi:PH domain-containing protein [Candidatus Saccharibacteria bacterium]|nr:PH domain-containing protein [Candidatus Saccharibacteria bacterium]